MRIFTKAIMVWLEFRNILSTSRMETLRPDMLTLAKRQYQTRLTDSWAQLQLLITLTLKSISWIKPLVSQESSVEFW